MPNDEDPTDLSVSRPQVRRGRLQVVLIGPQAFATIVLPESGELVIGRSSQADIPLDDTMASRRHAVLHLGEVLEIEDVGSANGTKLHDRALPANTRVAVGPGDVVTIGATALIVQPSAGSSRPRRLWPHGYFEGRLEDECARADRSGGCFAIALIQVGGDAVPAAVLEILAGTLRTSDVLARYGPRDYEALLIEADAAEAGAVIQRLLAQLEARSIRARCGVAVYPRDGRTPEALVAAVTGMVSDSKADVGEVSVVVEDPVMQRLHDLVGRVASGAINVLVLGETGVGKEVIAEAIHRRSPRAGRPFLRLNCAGLSETLLESDLFGHEKGSFTGAIQAKAGLLETAQGGTVLLDEIGELSPALQARLLRVIDTHEVLRVGGLKPRPIDVRFVAATNRDLEAEIARGTFRQDLYYRLNGFTLIVPPLRQRVAEIKALTHRFVAEASRRAGRPPATVSPSAMELLQRYGWPGNVRELRNVIERAVVLCTSDEITVDHLPVEKMGETLVFAHVPGPAHVLAASSARSRSETLPGRDRAVAVPVDADGDATLPPTDTIELTAEERAERDRITDALERTAGNQSRASRLLGISRGTLILRLERYRIRRPRRGQPRSE